MTHEDDMMRWIGGLFFAATLLVGCSDDEPMCFGSEAQYAIGEVFMDGCRQCTCNDDTTITCVATAECDTGCEDNEGNDVEVGSYFPAGDGCNLCQCVSAGEVECTDDPCGM